MTPTDYRLTLKTANDTIILAKNMAKDYVNSPNIKRHAIKMIMSAYQVKSIIVNEAKRDYPFIDWMTIAIGDNKTELNENGAIMHSEDKRNAKIKSLIAHRAPKD